MSKTDVSIARKGIEEVERVNQLFCKLLEAVGNGNLMFDKTKNLDPASVPAKCEQNNAVVAELLENIQKSLNEAKQCYQYCRVEMSSSAPQMPSLEELASQTTDGMKEEKSPEYVKLKKELQAKNADLKFIIDEVRHIFSDINQLSTSVPY